MGQAVYVAGVGMTPFAKHATLSVKQLSAWAVQEALADASGAMSEIEAIYFGNAMQGHMDGQHCIRGEVALRDSGFARIPIVNVENACASGATAFCEAVKFIRSGEGDIALALGVEKLWSDDRRLTFSAFDSAWDVSSPEENMAALASLGKGLDVPRETASDRPYSRFLDVYAAFARFSMKEFGLTQRQLAAVAAKNHQHSVHNERAQFRRAYTVEEIMMARPIVYPLTLPMCSPIGDGAAAAIVCSLEGLGRLNSARSRAIKVRASVLGSGVHRSPAEYETKHIMRLTALRAYERSGVDPRDVSVAEVHDATAVGEAIAMECLGFAAPGDGGAMAEAGVTAIGGKLPVNPSGGLEAKGHPVGATGLGQIFELVAQLRQECGKRQVEHARIGLAENGGGLLGIEEAACAITILEKE